jgi:hypothetical protein
MNNPIRKSPARAAGAAAAFLLIFAGLLAPLSAEAPREPFVQIVPHAEIGYVAILSHLYRSGPEGTATDFDFVKQGGQDNLYPYQRFSADVVLGGRNRVTLLYQPLTVNTRTVADRNGSNGGNPVVIDDATFAPGTPMDITYGFDFWRVSYLFDFARSPDTILGLGLSLQLRNASIVFTSVDTTPAVRAVQQNIGPVPILKARAAHWFSPAIGVDFEADGFYASSAIFNGSGKPFEGWIWDAALSAKTHLAPKAVAFLTVRSIGGGALGTNAYDYRSATTNVSGETYNALATLAVVVGFSLE